MDSKSYFMGGLSLKPMPKIVTKNETNKSTNRQNRSLDSKHSKNSSQNTLNKSLIASNPQPPPPAQQQQQQQTNSILCGNSLNQNLSTGRSQSPLPFKNRLQLIGHTENLLKHRTQKSVSLLQKSPIGSPGKMQSLLPKRSILNTMNSNLIANQYNSSNLLINSLMKTTTNVSTNSLINQQEKTAASSSEKLVDDKMIRVIKLCVTKLEFSSPLFKRIATKMSFLYIKPQYEHIRNYERFCGTSNKAVLKQVMNRGHTLKYKPSGNRSRMLRSNEIVDGKVMISWQRSAYVHVYTFNRRQRLRRYRQISMDLGFEHRTLQIMYGLKKVTLNRILECPCCKKRINPNLHYCVVSRKTISNKRLRSSAKTTSLLKRAVPKIKFNDSVQTSDYVSNESDNSLDLGIQYGRERRSLLEDSKINLQKLSPANGEQASPRRCPTLLLDSSNYKTNQNSISNVVVKRMDSKELNKKMNSMQRSRQQQQQPPLQSPTDRLQIRKVDSLPARSLIKCRVIDQHNFMVSSLENSIKIVFK